MPIQRQLGPPASLVVRLNRSQISRRRCVVPLDPLAVARVVPVLAGGDGLAGGGAELARAVVAVADAVALQPAPTVVGEAFGMAALDDLAQNAGDVLVVVGAVDAGDVLVVGAVGLAVGLAGEPVGMGLEEILGGAVAIHARQHGEPVLMGGLREFAVEIASLEELGAVMERELARVVGDDAAGIDDDALDARALPIVAPPGDVVVVGIALGDVGLAPAADAAVPGEARLCRRLGGGSYAGLDKVSSGHEKIYFSANQFAMPVMAPGRRGSRPCDAIGTTATPPCATPSANRSSP